MGLFGAFLFGLGFLVCFLFVCLFTWRAIGIWLTTFTPKSTRTWDVTTEAAIDVYESYTIPTQFRMMHLTAILL